MERNLSGRRVRVAKVGIVENPSYRTPEWSEYEFGERNAGVSVPLNYWLEGQLVWEPKVGDHMLVDRSSRNGIELPGLFETSPVTAVESVGSQLRVSTRNSVYMVAPLAVSG